MAFTPRFIRAYPPAVTPEGPVILLRFLNGELVFHTEMLTPTRLERALEGAIFLGMLDNVPCLIIDEQPESELLPDQRTVGLRSLYGQVDDIVYGIVGYAAQILRWHRTGLFCSACGAAMRDLPNTWGKECPRCGSTFYPPVSPAVLALVHDSDRILLAQKPGWGKRFSILAGFVEPGESLEDCVHREVKEEVGVDVEAPVYMGSQPWPFPHQIMIGFTCAYIGGDITLDETELERAQWFRYDELPELPPALSLSRQIIDRWVESRRQLSEGLGS